MAVNKEQVTQQLAVWWLCCLSGVGGGVGLNISLP